MKNAELNDLLSDFNPVHIAVFLIISGIISLFVFYQIIKDREVNQGAFTASMMIGVLPIIMGALTLVVVYRF